MEENWNNKKVDIIIPIYNALDDLKKCVDSVLKHTDLGRHRLVLLNDNSSDERVKPYIESYMGYGNILVYSNEKNLGFSGNINKGILLSEKNDVLLLNSDTIVTEQWIEKILKCAYSAPEIGTVTPLSNNATICSVPEFCQENPVPEELSVDEMGELVERVSLKKYPRIPVAHGFCMFIKREVVKKIGLFDAETFGRGYGEENDFCFRAEQVGYTHVMCDDTYICHTGTSSFQTEEKKKYIEEHEQILKERYPTQFKKVQIYCRDNPNHMIQENVKLHLRCHNHKQNLLYLVQADFKEGASDNVGGTQLHVQDLTFGLKDTFNIFVVARDRAYLNITAYIEQDIVAFRYYIGEKPLYQEFRNELLGNIYGDILDIFKINLVHIHHVIGMSYEMFYQAYERKIPIILTLHDYYMLCPTIKLLNCENQVCWEKPAEEECTKCLESRCGIRPSLNYMALWKKQNYEVLQMCKQIIVPSLSAKKIICAFYPDLDTSIQVIEHGMDLELGRDDTKHRTGAFRVAFIGGLNEAKGSEYAYQMIKNGKKEIQWYVFGEIGDNHLRTLECRNLTKFGSYKREQLPDLLKKNEIDLVCIMPIWPETFCYTLSEAILCNIPVLAVNVGALGERVQKMHAGWLIPYGASYEKALDIVHGIMKRGDAFQQVKEKLASIEMKPLKDMIKEYNDVYQAKLQKDILRKKTKAEYVLKAYQMANGENLDGEGAWIQSLLNSEKELMEIKTSTTYRIVEKMTYVKLPFRKQLKAVIMRLYRFGQR